MFDIRTLQNRVGEIVLLWLNSSKEKSTSCSDSVIVAKGREESEHPQKTIIENRKSLMIF